MVGYVDIDPSKW